MRRFLLLLLQRAFAFPALSLRVLPRFIAPRDRTAASAASAWRCGWGEIRARYRDTNRRVPA